MYVLKEVNGGSGWSLCDHMMSGGRDELKRFLYKDFTGIIEKLMSDIEASLEVETQADFRRFVCDFYTEAVAGTLINVFQNPDLYTKEQLIEYFGVIVHNSIPEIIKSYKYDYLF